MADDPRIPDLWWSPTNHLYRGGTERPCADAVKLGDVERAEAERDLAMWLHAELQHKLTLPCGSCHPCMNWADETWRRADRKPPTVGRWEDKLAETRGLYARLDDAIQLIEEMSNHLRQDPALAIGVETRLAALRADEPSEPQTGCMDGPAKQHTLHMVGIIDRPPAEPAGEVDRG